MENGSEVPETERILSRSSGPSEDRLGGEGGGVGSFPEDDEEGVGAFGDEDDVGKAIVQMKARDRNPTTAPRLPLSVPDKCLSRAALINTDTEKD